MSAPPPPPPFRVEVDELDQRRVIQEVDRPGRERGQVVARLAAVGSPADIGPEQGGCRRAGGRLQGRRASW